MKCPTSHSNITRLWDGKEAKHVEYCHDCGSIHIGKRQFTESDYGEWIQPKMIKEVK